MSEQVPNSKQVPATINSASQKDSTGNEPGQNLGLPVPWGVYFTIYFVQGTIMQILLGNVGVFLYQSLGLDWPAVTTSFFIMLVPILLRPFFAYLTDRRPKSLLTFLILGLVLVTSGSIFAGLGSLSGVDGLTILIVSFSAGVVGATILNVVADSHIVRMVPLDNSAKVNSYKRIFAFIGVLLAQLGYVFIVGKNLLNLSTWAFYFTLPGICVVISFTLISIIKKSWRILPVVTGLPLLQAKWLDDKNLVRVNQKGKWFPIIVLIFILLLINIPDGLIETPWENFIIDLYGAEAWVSYSSMIVLGGFIAGAGFIIARKSGKRAPEWDFLWFAPILTVFYLIVLLAPPFPIILWATVTIQIVVGFMQVRILQSMQSHSYFAKAGLAFQIFMVTYQGGKFIGIGMLGFIMTIGGYTALFAGTVVIWEIIFGLSIILWATTLRPSKK